MSYYVETYHAANFNINQASANAALLNSHNFGLVDIHVNSGMLYNPKYYSTEDQCYSAGAELLVDQEGIIAKYSKVKIKMI